MPVIHCDCCSSAMDPDIDVQHVHKQYNPLVDASIIRYFCSISCMMEAYQ